MTIRIAVVDGTGPEKGYEQVMEKSFCHMLAKNLGDKPTAFYQRGPTMAGMETLRTAVEASKWLSTEWAQDKTIDIMLAGYSRGGSAVIMAAEALEMAGIPVRAMFLFDPVGRHVYAGGEVIPANVRMSRTALRDQSWGFVSKYEGTISDDPRLGKTSNPTRPSFGNVGLTWRGDGDHKSATFTGTHGALGGVGWGFVAEDRTCQPAVAGWMEKAMDSVGLQVKLGLGSLSTAQPLQAGKVTKFFGKVADAGMIANTGLNRIFGGQQ